MRLEMTRNKV